MGKNLTPTFARTIQDILTEAFPGAQPETTDFTQAQEDGQAWAIAREIRKRLEPAGVCLMKDQAKDVTGLIELAAVDSENAHRHLRDAKILALGYSVACDNCLTDNKECGQRDPKVSLESVQQRAAELRQNKGGK